MFSAILRVLRHCPRARFVIIGGDAAEIEQYRARCGGDERVHFIGRVSPASLPNYLRAADVLLSPRRAGRNTPLKILDYLKAGRPIVAVEGEANRLILDEDVARLTPRDEQAFARAIVELMENDAIRQSMGASAKRRVAERFSFDEFKKRIGLCYRSVGVPPPPK